MPSSQRMEVAAVTRAERAIRWSTVAAVAVVAAVAGWVSYSHALSVVRAHGETGPVSWAYPLTIDGLIYAGSMVLLDAARRGTPAPPLARWLLGTGIVATVVTNVLAGLAHGLLGAIVAAWPALALVGSYELLMMVIRAGAAPAADTAVPGPPAGLNGHAHEAAERYAAEVARGEVPGVRRIRREMHMGQPRAQEVREYLTGLART
jgi:hypothetical protein